MQQLSFLFLIWRKHNFRQNPAFSLGTKGLEKMWNVTNFSIFAVPEPYWSHVGSYADGLICTFQIFFFSKYAHFTENDDPRKKALECEICGKKYNDKRELNRHKQSHLGDF